LVNRHGMRAMALNFPVTFPPPAIDGYVVPGWMPWRQLRLGCHPPDLYDRLRELPGFTPQELAMDMANEEKALEGCSREEYTAWIALHGRREHRWHQILEMLVNEEDPCELVTVLFDGVDKLQHLFWRFLDPAYAHTVQEPWEQQVQMQVVDYFRQLDGLLAQIVRLAGPDATVILASDHGFGPQVRTFFVNAWLEARGDLVWAGKDTPQPDASRQLGVGQIARHTYLLDWERTRAYAPLPSGNGIHIVRASDQHPGGVPEAEYESFRARLTEDLLAVKEPVTGTPVVSQVWKREDVFAGSQADLAPDLTLVLEDGGLISILASDEVVRSRPQVSGTHRPEGVLVAQGPALREGERLPELSILDVAPLVLYSLDLPIPVEMEGQLPQQAVAAAALQARPAKAGHLPEPESGSLEESPVSGSGLDEEAEEAILRRLQALGYVD
jgi:predicted AlkP superfamily phosphohydrolase/phosphomutase